MADTKYPGIANAKLKLAFLTSQLIHSQNLKKINKAIELLESLNAQPENSG